jgi:hypothetical protein
MSTSTPERTLEQRQAALERANDVRLERVRLKREIRLAQNITAGRREAVALLKAPPPEALGMKVFDLLLAIPRYGEATVRNTLRRLAISHRKTIRGLTKRQCDGLVATLEALAEQPRERQIGGGR